MGDSRLVLMDIEDDGVAVVTLNRPQKRNALSASLIVDLKDALRALDLNTSVRSIVLTGPSGGPFSCKWPNIVRSLKKLKCMAFYSGCRSRRTQRYLHL